MFKETAFVILAAGLGTRMKSITPKALHTICGEPMIFYPIKTALSLNPKKVVIVTGHHAARVRDAVGGRFKSGGIEFAFQREQKGTADAVLSAKENLADCQYMIIYNGDLPFIPAQAIKNLGEEFARTGKKLAILTANLDNPFRFGRIVRDGAGMPLMIVEELDATEEQRKIKEVNVGVMMLDREYFFETVKGFTADNAKGEFHITDILKFTRGKGMFAGTYNLPDNRYCMQVNDRIELSAAERFMRDEINKNFMKNGVTLRDPETAYIEESCSIGSDTVIEPSVTLRGGTEIGKGCFIGTGSVIENSKVGDGVSVLPYSVIEESVIEDGCAIGPFAHLRPGSVMKRRSKIGNFVEMKKSVLGEDSKANHLTYLGDCTVGRDANIGAGTITCNFDGVKKHPTEIGDGAFIGSNTEIVAPVKIGRNAYTAAGTTVTVDVPDGALAISRVKQVNIEGFAERKKQRKTE